MRRIGTILFVVVLCVFPLCALAQAQGSDVAVEMRIHGGIGVHFIIKNSSPYNVTIKYTIETGRSVQKGVVYAPRGGTTTRSFFPIAFFSDITVLLDSGESRFMKSGFIIGFFVILV